MTTAASPLIRTMDIKNLPTLPHILLRVLDLCNRDDTSLQDIAELVGQDAALSSKVIGACNTAQFSRQNKFVSFEQNLSMLGLDMVKTITISSSFYQVFNNLNLSPGFDLKAFWGASLTSALMAKAIAKEMDYPYAEEAYLAGLLLNIGQLVLWSNSPKQYAALLADQINDEELLAQETEKLGNNHCEVGAWLVNSWDMNSFIADAVLYHHMPREKIANTHLLIKIAHIANSLTMSNAKTTTPYIEEEQLSGISAESLRRIVDSARAQANNVAQSIGIEITTRGEDGVAAEKNDQDNMRQQKTQLAMELRDIVLIGRNPLGASATNSLDETLVSIQRSVQILFGFQNIAFFLPDQKNRILKGRCLSGQGMLINEISLPLSKEISLITDAFLGKIPTDSFGRGDTIIPCILDEQIIRLMDADGFFCQPLFTQNTLVGALVFGVSQAQLINLKKQQKLVSMFAQQSAQAIALLNAFDEQEARIKTEMMASVREKTRQIAHEASNPLSIIKNYIHLLGVKLSKEDRAQEDLKIIQAEIDRVSRILQGLSATTERREELDPNELIRNLYKISFESLFTLHRITVETQFDPALPTIVSNRDKLIQVLINLIKNAAEAMPNGGVVSISTRLNIPEDGNDYIEISIRDNGPGIPPQIMENLFKPVTSTKGSKHAGLGLSIVKSMVDELRGRIFCQSSATSGTAFQILLPRHS